MYVLENQLKLNLYLCFFEVKLSNYNGMYFRNFESFRIGNFNVEHFVDRS
jgi:hypothetical protein